MSQGLLAQLVRASCLQREGLEFEQYPIPHSFHRLNYPE